VTDPQLVFDQKIDLPFTYTIGTAQRAFLRGLTEGKLVASTGGGERYVPARPFAPDGRRLEGLEEVEPRGRVIASTTAHHRPEAPAFGLVLVDGCATPMLHRLEEELLPGTAVEAVFEPGAEPGIRAIRCFRRSS
jgi:uncharacterized OB-fold protein